MPVPGFEHLYEVSDHGRVRSLDRVAGSGRYSRRVRGRVLTTGGLPYRAVGLCRDGDHITRRIHRLVALAFLGPQPEGHEVAHNDGDKLNNRASNLRWATRASNVADTIRHGRMPNGSRKPEAKLTELAVIEMRSLYRAGLTQREIGEWFGVSQQTAQRALTGKTWRHVPGAVRSRCKREVARRRARGANGVFLPAPPRNLGVTR